MSLFQRVRRLLILYRHGVDPDHPERERCYREAMQRERCEEALEELRAMNGITQHGKIGGRP